MCGRFQLSVKGKEISKRFNVEVFDDMYSPSFNCAPSQKLPVITNSNPGELSFFQWGLVPAWAKDPKIGFKLINARSETIQQKPAFKKAFEQRRCLIPANGFFEWRKNDKTPFRIFLKDEPVFAIAGIWETWLDAEQRALQTFSILTTEASSTMKRIHPRMPVILSRQNEEAWLMDNNFQNLIKLLKPVEDSILDMYPVSTKINSVKNNSPDIIYPVSVGIQGELF